LRGIEVDAALTCLREGRPERSDVRQKLDLLAAELDEEYFRLSEEAGVTTDQTTLTFRKARAAEALAVALSPGFERLHEAIYEAIFAADNQTEAARMAEVALSIAIGG